MSGLFLIGRFETGKDFAQIGDGFLEEARESLAIFDDDFRPHGGVSGSYAGGIAQAAATEAAF